MPGGDELLLVEADPAGEVGGVEEECDGAVRIAAVGSQLCAGTEEEGREVEVAVRGGEGFRLAELRGGEGGVAEPRVGPGEDAEEARELGGVVELAPQPFALVPGAVQRRSRTRTTSWVG